MKVLMVCLGNICRSPLAEGILKKITTEKNLNWQVDSAGTGAYHVGELPDPRSIQVAQAHHIDITDQRAQQFKVGHFDLYDWILVMDSSNYQNVLQLARHEQDRAKVQLIMNFAKPDWNEAVPDPYWDDNGFEKVYQMLHTACDAFVAQQT